MANTWTINGVDLDGLAHNIETWDGLLTAPGVVGDDIDVAGWHGALDPHGQPGQQRRPLQPGKWAVSMWVLGVDPVTGVDLSDSASLRAVHDRITTLTRLLYSRSLTIVHHREDGTQRQAVGHLAGSPIGFSVTPGSPWFGQFNVEVTLPDPLWYVLGSPVTVSGSWASGQTVNLAPFAAASAPMRAVTVEWGPGNNPSFSHAGGALSWLSMISAGRSLGVACDPADPSLYAAAGSWTPSYTPLAYSPGPSWVELDPASPTGVLTHTGGGSMSMSITARLAHLTA